MLTCSFKSALGPLLQLAPLLFIVVLGLLSNFMVGDPAFSLSQHGYVTHNSPRMHTHLKNSVYVIRFSCNFSMMFWHYRYCFIDPQL